MWTEKNNPRLPVQNKILPPHPPLNDAHFSVHSSKKQKSGTPYSFGFSGDPMLPCNTYSRALESSKDPLGRYTDFGSSVSTNYQGPNSGTPYNFGFSSNLMLPRNSDSQALEPSKDWLNRPNDFGSSISTKYPSPHSGTPSNFGFSRDPMMPSNSDSPALESSKNQLYRHSDFGSSISTNYLGFKSGAPYNFGLSGDPTLQRNSDSQALVSSKDQFNRYTGFGPTWQTGNGYFRDGAVDRIRGFSPIVMSQYSHQRGHFPLSNLQSQEHYTFSKTEVHTPLNHLQSVTANTENVASKSVNFGNSNLGPTNNFPLEGIKLQSDTSGTPSDLKKSGLIFNHVSNIGGASFGVTAFTEHNEDDRMFTSGNAPSDVSRDDNGKGRVNENTDVVMKNVTIDHQNMNPSSSQGASPLHGQSPAKSIDKSCQRDDQRLNSLRSDENSNLLPENEAPSSTEKLWDGDIQLSSTVTMSALAFFKSGEKMPGVKWSESVEVKGKVRLESFENYIQDLPRSCNRGLMVISLRWKEGSPKIGLDGMKEVAEKYEKGKKVGYALLSPGVDLYICPRSDTIFTILAKYGYLKGMAAVEDIQDSLLGCVVWRRNKIAPSSVEKKSDIKNQSVNEEAGAKNEQEAQKSSSNAPTTDFALPGNEGRNLIESKSVVSSKVQHEAFDSSTNNSSSVISSVKGNIVEPPVIKFSEFEKVKPSLELQKPTMLLPHNEDDDDLPEFDFYRASSCKTSLPPLSKSSNAATLNQGMPISDIPFVSVSEANYVSQSSVTVTPNNRFDDDDMPEWCPPNLHFQNPPLPKSVRPSTAPPMTYNASNSESVRPSITPISTFESLSYGHPQKSLQRFPTPGPHPSYNAPNSELVRPAVTPMSTFENLSNGPQKSLQRFPTPGDFTSEYNTTKPAVLQRDPNISRGFNPAPVFRPPPHSPFDVSWKGWRPS